MLQESDTNDAVSAAIIGNGISLLFPPWLFGPLVVGTTMRPVNGIFLYWLGGLQQLFAMADNVDISAYDPLFQRSIEIIDRFVDTPQNAQQLPDSVGQANAIRAILLMVQRLARENPRLRTTLRMRLDIAHAVNAFQTILERELAHTHTYILEQRRGYSPETLIGTERLISPAVLPWLSEFTIYNLKDAGAALVFDRFTACGYHVMRAVEDTARRYYVLVTSRPSVRRKNNGELHYHTLGQVAHELSDFVAALKPKPVGKLGLITPTLEALCEIYRNPLSHPEITVLDEDEAIDVFNKGIDVISTMVRDVLVGNPHFSVGTLMLFSL